MLVISNLNQIPEGLTKQKSVVTIGNFDGVHRGHRTLVRTLVQEGQARNLPTVVVTFDPHPVQVLFPERGLLRIFDRDDQISELEKLQVDYLLIETFTKKLSQLSAEDYFKKHILTPLAPKLLIVGYDFSFGANRSGSIPQIMEFSKIHGFELLIVPPQKIEDQVVSSSRVRQCVLDSDFESAAKLLDRPFYVKGIIEKGLKRGRGLGFPTANLKISEQLSPPGGVYITRSCLSGQVLPSVTNVGVNPTFEDKLTTRIETHILDSHLDIYGQTLKVEFLKKLRDEKKFASVDDLKNQIKEDILKARKYFSMQA